VAAAISLLERFLSRFLDRDIGARAFLSGSGVLGFRCRAARGRAQNPWRKIPGGKQACVIAPVVWPARGPPSFPSLTGVRARSAERR
jgi:hypothetical protein